MKPEDFINSSSRIVPEAQFQKLLDENAEMAKDLKELRDSHIKIVMKTSEVILGFFIDRNIPVTALTDYAWLNGSEAKLQPIPGSNKMLLTIRDRKP